MGVIPLMNYLLEVGPPLIGWMAHRVTKATVPTTGCILGENARFSGAISL